MSAVKKTVEKQEETMEKIGEVRENDCYDCISESSKPRELTKSAYGKTYNARR